MKVLIFNVHSHTGSTGKIAYNFMQYLRNNGHQVKLLCRGVGEEAIIDDDVISLTTRPLAMYSAFMSRLVGIEGLHNAIPTKKAISIIKKFNPDIVLLYNLKAYYINHYDLLNFLKSHNYKVVYTMIDEFPYLGKCSTHYDCMKFQTHCCDCPSYKVYPESWFFDRTSKIFDMKAKIYKDFNNLFFIAPQWVKETALTSALLKDKVIYALDEPINYDEVYFPREVSHLRIKHSIPRDNKIVIGVGPYNSKGGEYFVELAKKLYNRKDITFVFINFDVEVETPDNIIKLPRLDSNAEVAEYLSLADIYVCTSLNDTQSDTCLEALGCGTPLCGFAERGTPYIASPPLGVFTPTYDIDALAKVVEKCQIKRAVISEACVDYARARFDSSVIYKKTLDIFNKILNENK